MDILSYTSYSRCSDDIHIKILLAFSILILISVSFSSMTLKYLILMNFSKLLNTNLCKLYTYIISPYITEHRVRFHREDNPVNFVHDLL